MKYLLTIVFVMMSVVHAPNITQAQEIPVYIFLAEHEAQGTEFGSQEKAAIQDIQNLIRKHVTKTNPDRITYWVEAGIPTNLSRSISDLDGFVQQVARTIKVNYQSVLKSYVFPEQVAPGVRNRVLQWSQYAFNEGFKKYKEEDLLRHLKPGDFDYHIIKGLMKDWVGWELFSEIPTFQSWISVVRSSYWHNVAYQKLFKGQPEEAIRFMYYTQGYLNENTVLRDQKLASDIRKDLSQRPGRIHVVVRGARHILLAKYLSDQRIQSKNIYQAISREKTQEEIFIRDYQPLPQHFHRAAYLSSKERIYIMKIFLDGLVQSDFAIQNKIISKDLNREISRTIKRIPSKNVQNWFFNIARSPRSQKYVLKTATDLIKKHSDEFTRLYNG